MQPIETLLSQLTLEEKAALVTGASLWTTAAVERLGIPGLFVTDGPHGVRKATAVSGFSGKNLPATCFPTASSLAATWDTALMAKLGQALGEECVALGVDVLLGPGVNMKRSPLCGRNFEYFAEDPYQAGEMAASLIHGIQGQGVGVSLKHFAANNQETKRFSVSAEVDERSLREIYLPAFEKAVKQGQPWMVMCAYNKLNGVYASENHWLLDDILKKEWGFDGLVVSDWGAVHDRVEALKGSLDLEMPGPQPARTQAVIDAVKSGALDPETLEESVRRILSLIAKAAQTPKAATPAENDGMNLEKNKTLARAHHALAREIAADGMVLLKNNGILPLKGQSSIAVIGRAAKEPRYQGGGSSHMNPTHLDVPFDELQALAVNASLTYAAGYPADDSGAGPASAALIEEAVMAAKAAETALLFIGLPASKEIEGHDRPDLDLTPAQAALIQAVTAVQPRSVVILNNGSAVAMSAWIDGAAAVLEAWLMGQAGGGAIADVLFGRVNPSGKLTETFPLRLADTPAYLNFPGENNTVRYGEGLYIGYRYYDAVQAPALFPFGFGLSYTTFAYRNPRVSATAFKDQDGLVVSVDVTNTGSVAGKETVQVYVHDVASQLARPPKELKGFAKVALAPGETKTVAIALDFRAFAYYHPGYHAWITEDGDFEILIGASSADIRCVQTVTLQSTVKLPCILTRDSTMGEWMADPQGIELLLPLFQQFMSAMPTPGSGDDLDLGMDMMEMIKDMPLSSLGMFAPPSATGGMSMDQIVDGLVKQLK